MYYGEITRVVFGFLVPITEGIFVGPGSDTGELNRLSTVGPTDCSRFISIKYEKCI